MKVLALDQALTITGFAVFSEKNLEKYGVLNLGDIARDKELMVEEKDYERTMNVKMFLNKMIKAYDINFVVLEDVQAQKNVNTFKKLASLQGVLKQRLYENEIPFKVYKPSEWRKILGIKGNKREIQKKNSIEYISVKYNVEVTDDEADAICLGLAYVGKIK
ncbi:MAG: crossover junction endodeoxyribonuclease RuvC [Sarcina sp.]